VDEDWVSKDKGNRVYRLTGCNVRWEDVLPPSAIEHDFGGQQQPTLVGRPRFIETGRIDHNLDAIAQAREALGVLVEKAKTDDNSYYLRVAGALAKVLAMPIPYGLAALLRVHDVEKLIRQIKPERQP